MKKIEEIKFSESKDLMISVLDSIRNTRDKSWQTMAIIIAIQSFLITDLFLGDYASLKSISFYISIPFFTYIYYLCFNSIFPSNIALNGMKISQFFKDDNFSDLSKYYNRAIDENLLILDKMIINYKKSIKSFFVFILTVLIFFLFMFIKCKEF